MQTGLQSNPADPVPLGSGIAQHACDDGCQIVVLTGKVRTGQRLVLQPEGREPICGTVRWAIGDRIALAFDRTISREVQSALTRFYTGAIPFRLLVN